MAVARFFRSSPLGGVCGLVLLLLVSVAVLADRLAPQNPLTANYAVTRDPPLGRHALGTDHLGRDVLSRIIFGARVTLLVAISSVLLGDTIGFIWGLASGYLGGRVDLISQRVLSAVDDLAETEPLGVVSLKGLARPIPVFDVRRLKQSD